MAQEALTTNFPDTAERGGSSASRSSNRRNSIASIFPIPTPLVSSPSSTDNSLTPNPPKESCSDHSPQESNAFLSKIELKEIYGEVEQEAVEEAVGNIRGQESRDPGQYHVARFIGKIRKKLSISAPVPNLFSILPGQNTRISLEITCGKISGTIISIPEQEISLEFSAGKNLRLRIKGNVFDEGEIPSKLLKGVYEKNSTSKTSSRARISILFGKESVTVIMNGSKIIDRNRDFLDQFLGDINGDTLQIGDGFQGVIHSITFVRMGTTVFRLNSKNEEIIMETLMTSPDPLVGLSGFGNLRKSLDVILKIFNSIIFSLPYFLAAFVIILLLWTSWTPVQTFKGFLSMYSSDRGAGNSHLKTPSYGIGALENDLIESPLEIFGNEMQSIIHRLEDLENIFLKSSENSNSGILQSLKQELLMVKMGLAEKKHSLLKAGKKHTTNLF